jgi:uncharacterized membrane protein SpoIIM required for sporulation
MIIDLKRFISVERPFWDELAELIKRREDDPYRRMDYAQIKRLFYLYQRASADLAKISTFSAERAIRDYLETLVARAYAIIHASHEKAIRFSPLKWFWYSFPGTFRRRWSAFAFSVAVFLVGSLFGAGAIVMDPDAKAVLMPFSHLQMDPSERVAQEEKDGAGEKDRLKGKKTTFSAFLMTHNTRVSILVLALGMSWGIGTCLLLFSNGVMLGAVAADYIVHSQSAFLMGWLLPHGVVEIPAILIAGQAGLVLAGALIGRQSALPMGERIRKVGTDIVHLIGGVAVLLVWAGIVEAFFSQYHEPVLPYSLKIAFGLVEFCLVGAFLVYAGRSLRNKSGRRWQP